MSTFNPLAAQVNATADAYGIPQDVFTNLVNTESSGNPYAVSSTGAEGLTQLMPNTANSLGVEDPFDPQQNLDAGASYLSSQFKKFGNWTQALEAYNGGPTAVTNGDVSPSAVSYANGILSGTASANSQPSASANSSGSSIVSYLSGLIGTSINPVNIVTFLVGMAFLVAAFALFVAPKILGGANTVTKTAGAVKAIPNAVSTAALAVVP